MRRVDACATTGGFLGVSLVRRGVRAEEKSPMAAGRRLEQRLPIGFSLEHRQAVKMRADAAAEHLVAVVEQVLRRNRRRNALARVLHEPHRCGGGDVLENHA
jgi:hypothetical protein